MRKMTKHFKYFLKIKEALISSVNGCSQLNESKIDDSNAENKTIMKEDEIQNTGSPIIESSLEPDEEVQMYYLV